MSRSSIDRIVRLPRRAPFNVRIFFLEPSLSDILRHSRDYPEKSWCSGVICGGVVAIAIAIAIDIIDTLDEVN